MNDILRNSAPDQQKKRAWLFSIIIIVYATVFMLSGNSGDTDASLILGIDPVLILILQGILSTFMFVLSSLLFIRFALKIPLKEFFPPFKLEAFGLVILIAISFMVINSAIGEWNMNLQFPDSSFTEWAKQSEEQLKVLTEHLTNFTSPVHYVLAMVVIGIIPAIGEELLFRGLLQSLLTKAFNNHHAAIWISGFIFAAIHMQFFGVFPRMFLGVLFGYLFYWSGNLSLAMVAHLINNGLALTLLYLSNIGTIEISPEQMESSAPWPVIVVFGLICTLAIWVFYKKYRLNNG
ncbi:MAG: type II CAAX endopeptidase family protein [Cyclobacteriaceae bacterium]